MRKNNSEYKAYKSIQTKNSEEENLCLTFIKSYDLQA